MTGGYDTLMEMAVLPGNCGIECDVELEEAGDTSRGRVRFTALRSGRWGEERSLPSGWFDLSDAPIRLTWSAFDFGEAN